MSTSAPAILGIAARRQPGQLRVSCRTFEAAGIARIGRFVEKQHFRTLAHDPRWPGIFADAFGHVPYVVEATRGETLVGVLPLMFVSSLLFKRFLVSQPYLNSGGVVADDPAVASCLVDRAIALADELDVRFLELRHEAALGHGQLRQPAEQKVHMRLALPGSRDQLWRQLSAKVRNQVRKGERHELAVHWGGHDLLRDFYRVFSRNMRDLGTPVFGRKLFEAILDCFPEEAELCVLRRQGRPVAAALLVHGKGVTEVPSASSLRKHNSTNANMLMYWHLLCRAVERGQQSFDFGRSSEGRGTYHFKKQWGARPEPAIWQYYLRHGPVNQMRPDSGGFDTLIRVWKKLPVPLTRLLGPSIVRGIP